MVITLAWKPVPIAFGFHLLCRPMLHCRLRGIPTLAKWYAAVCVTRSRQRCVVDPGSLTTSHAPHSLSSALWTWIWNHWNSEWVFLHLYRNLVLSLSGIGQDQSDASVSIRSRSGSFLSTRMPSFLRCANNVLPEFVLQVCLHCSNLRRVIF